jgi:mannose-6-phosphate isomerase-like protein (cupin superfamily)
MSSDITTPHVPPGSPVAGLPATGVLGGVLVGRDVDGKSMVEYVLPNRLPGGPAVPFEASWWTVEPSHETDPDQHAVQEMWFVARGRGRMWLGDDEFTVRAGQAVYLPSNHAHHVRAEGEEDLVVFSVWWP